MNDLRLRRKTRKKKKRFSDFFVSVCRYFAMVLGRPGEKASAPVSADAEGNPAGVVPVSRDADGEGLGSPLLGPSADAPYPSTAGEHDLDTAQAMVSFVLILVMATVACVLIVVVTRYTKGYRAGLHVVAHPSPPGKTSWPPLRH
ncbi:uncharacterized protein [Dermacentor andersoni]|uniref:uncharacterized protein n=1 Tax=Dermacentor andersoni TaxID=34620 RepID=UPI00241642FD|nr:uncharacterized protein LOC129387911 [Dermacentor andersoni]